MSFESKETEDLVMHVWLQYMKEGSSLLSAGEDLKACDFFARARKLRPKHGPTLLSLASALYRAGRMIEATEEFEEALELEPTCARAHHGLGLCLNAEGKRESALASFRRAVDHDPKAWKTWQSISEITSVEVERVNAVVNAAEALEAICRWGRASTDLFTACANALIDAHRYDCAAKFIKDNIASFPDNRISSHLLSKAAYLRGDFETAFHIKARAHLLSACSARARLPRAQFTPGAAMRALRDVWSVLQSNGLACFLVAGTLLGLYREGRLLPHDRDVDLGVVGTPGARPDIARALRECPYLTLPASSRVGDPFFSIMCHGIAVDIFVYEFQGDIVRAAFSDVPGDIEWRFSTFGLRARELAGSVWLIPDPVERYLEQSYGPGWCEPDPAFASAISSPALGDVSPYARALCSISRAEFALRSGNLEKARELIALCPIPAVAACTHSGPLSAEE